MVACGGEGRVLGGLGALHLKSNVAGATKVVATTTTTTTTATATITAIHQVLRAGAATTSGEVRVLQGGLGVLPHGQAAVAGRGKGVPTGKPPGCPWKPKICASCVALKVGEDRVGGWAAATTARHQPRPPRPANPVAIHVVVAWVGGGGRGGGLVRCTGVGRGVCPLPNDIRVATSGAESVPPVRAPQCRNTQRTQVSCTLAQALPRTHTLAMLPARVMQAQWDGGGGWQWGRRYLGGMHGWRPRCLGLRPAAPDSESCPSSATVGGGAVGDGCGTRSLGAEEGPTPSPSLAPWPSMEALQGAGYGGSGAGRLSSAFAIPVRCPTPKVWLICDKTKKAAGNSQRTFRET